MRLVTAVIKPHKWDDVRQALESFGITGMTVTEASGYDVALVPKLRVELVVEDADATDVVGVISMAAATGTIGDGKVWVVPVDTVVRVRTGEVDQAAL
jgi:nitrogen regulatory protein P-II 1